MGEWSKGRQRLLRFGYLAAWCGAIVAFPGLIVAETPPAPMPSARSAPEVRPTAGPAADVRVAIAPPAPPPRGGGPVGGETPGGAPPPRASPPPTGWWKPPVVLSWQWQLTTPVDLSVGAQMYDIDLYSNDATVVAALHALGRRVVCYFSAGTWEPNRPDSGNFPAAVLGSSYRGYPQEKWLDIRRLDVLGPIMQARMDVAKQRGCDGVEPDNVDGYANNTGFPLLAQDQLAYNRWLAQQAHARGLSVGLKNDGGQVGDLVGAFDWSLVEQCYNYNECELYLPFVRAAKPVFVVSYTVDQGQFCAKVNALNFNGLYKRVALDAFRIPCR